MLCCLLSVRAPHLSQFHKYQKHTDGAKNHGRRLLHRTFLCDDGETY